MSNIGPQIRSFVERIQELEEIRKTAAEDIRDILKEAKAADLNPQMIRALVKRQMEDAGTRAKREAFEDELKVALGLLADTPLGRAAMQQGAIK